MIKFKNILGCAIPTIIVVGLFSYFLVDFYGEKDYEKEMRIEKQINGIFIKTLDSDFVNVVRNLEDSQVIDSLKLNGIICPLQIFYNNYNDIYELIGIDHYLTRDLLDKNFRVSFNKNIVDYYILTATKIQTVGDYIDSDGKKVTSAKLTTIEIYIYDNRQKKIYFVLSNKGQLPKNKIQYRLESIGSNWDSKYILKYLIENKFLNVNEKKSKFYNDGYLNYLENNNFLGLEIK